MNEKLQVIMHTFKINMYLVENVLKDLSEEDFKTRSSDNTNSMQYLLAHIIGSRSVICRFLGIDFSADYLDKVRRGVPTPSAEEIPEMEMAKKSWAEVSENMFKGLQSVTDEKLAEDHGGQYPFEDDSVFGAISFLAYHETYHLGQMAYVRRLLGHSQLVG